MHTLFSIAHLSSACLLIVASQAAGQGNAPPASSAQSSSSAGASGTLEKAPTVLHAKANLVLVDVVVTDRGKAVHGIGKEQFHIFDDRHEQTIVSFDERTPAAVQSSSAEPVVMPANTYSNVPAFPEATAVDVLLLDGLNTPMADQIYVRRQMLLYMGKIPPGTSMAVFTLSSRLRMIEGFTTDASRLAKALQNPKATPQPSVILDPEADNSLNSAVDEMTNSGSNPDAIMQMQQFVADTAAFHTDQRVQMTMEALQQLARYLSAIPGRKNLIWFSGSFPISLDPDLTLEDPTRSVRNYLEQVRETSQLLSAARVAVYPVDARGLMNLSTTDVEYAPTINQSIRNLQLSVAQDNMKFMQQTISEHASMKQIAEQTGGQAYLNTNGFKEAVADIIDKGARYYTIGYVPSIKQLDAKFHKILVRADNDAWQLAYRHGYYANPSDKPSAVNPGKTSSVVAATLHGAPPSTQILFQARVLPATDPQLKGAKLPDGPAGEMTATLKGPPNRYIVDVLVDPRQLAFTVTAGSVYQAEIEFALVAYDSEARCVNDLDRPFLLKLKAEQYAQIMTTGIHVRFPIDLPAGQNSLRIAVYDLATLRAGSLEAPLTGDIPVH